MAKFEFSSSFQHVKNISISFFSRNIGLGEEPLINLVSSKNITMFLKPVNFLKIYLIKFTLKGYSTMEVMLNYRETDKLQSRVTHTKGTSKVYIQNQTCLCVLINTRHVIFFPQIQAGASVASKLPGAAKTNRIKCLPLIRTKKNFQF